LDLLEGLLFFGVEDFGVDLRVGLGEVDFFAIMTRLENSSVYF
jgi:hypothetical protein